MALPNPREDHLPVSVIVPVYNRADLLPRALASVESQQPRAPAEVIVVDDGSQDDVAAVAEALGARVIRHAVNRGLAAARNTGVAAASHDWVALLDSDDEWLPHHLATLWALRDGHALVGGSAMSCRSDPRADRIVGPLTRAPRVLADPLPLLHPQNFITASTTLVRRDVVLDAGGFAPHEGVVEDLDMWVRLLDRETAVVSPTVSTAYHVHDEQMSGDRGRMRAGHRSAIAAYADRWWWSPKLPRRWEGVEAWDCLADALAARSWTPAAGQVLRILQRPARVRGMLDVLRWRFRARRATGRVTRAGTPSVAVAMREPQLRRRVLASTEAREILDFRPASLARGAARLIRRPTGVLLVDTWGMALMGKCLGIPPVDARRITPAAPRASD